MNTSKDDDEEVKPPESSEPIHYVMIADTGYLGLKLQEPQQPTQEQQSG